MTKLVRSETFGDCFTCVVAMATGRTRQEVLEGVTLSDFQGTKYLHMLEATRYLASLGYRLGAELLLQNPTTIIEGDLLARVKATYPAVLTVEEDVSEFTHCVYWDGNKVWDPCKLEPHELKELGSKVWCLPVSLFDGGPCR